MAEYRIVTDSGCDISPEILDSWGVLCVDLSYRFSGENFDRENRDCDIKEFYAKMREGRTASTSAANYESFRVLFESELEKGNDVLYIAFSSGLSSIFNNAYMTHDELTEKYPDRKLIMIDTLSASAGEAMLLNMAVKAKKDGKSIEEAEKIVRENIHKLAHWYTVDDLMHLKRGGRIDAKTAIIGTVLSIKPVMHMDDEGHLTPVTKVKGRKTAIKALADKYTELAVSPESGEYYISHADCLEDAEKLDSILSQRYGKHAEIITYVGPVIGAHCGPGTLALFFVAKNR